jgi:ABC-2 type transport system ATP-binding protein
MIGLQTAAVTAIGRFPPQQRMVHVSALTKRFVVRRSWLEMALHPRDRQFACVLDAVDFSVAEGECFGILGPNGAGKTTLFKILATLIRPDGGTATIGGRDVRTDPDGVRRLLSPVIPEERSLNWRLSGYENLRLFAAIHRVPQPEREVRVSELLETVGLSDAGNKIVAQYSSGMKQRLLIARALIPRPRVLLLDEPTRSLDPVATRKFHEFIRSEILAAQGCTVIIATHDPEEALSLCDRIAIMDKGTMLAVGAPRALLASSTTDRYRLWTTTPEHTAFAALDVRVLSPTVAAAEEVDGWAPVELEIAGGLERASEINSSLVLRGVQIAHFERVQKALSEYIEEVVEQRGRKDD